MVLLHIPKASLNRFIQHCFLNSLSQTLSLIAREYLCSKYALPNRPIEESSVGQRKKRGLRGRFRHIVRVKSLNTQSCVYDTEPFGSSEQYYAVFLSYVLNPTERACFASSTVVWVVTSNSSSSERIMLMYFIVFSILLWRSSFLHARASAHRACHSFTSYFYFTRDLSYSCRYLRLHRYR